MGMAIIESYPLMNNDIPFNSQNIVEISKVEDLSVFINNISCESFDILFESFDILKEETLSSIRAPMSSDK